MSVIPCTAECTHPIPSDRPQQCGLESQPRGEGRLSKQLREIEINLSAEQKSGTF